MFEIHKKRERKRGTKRAKRKKRKRGTKKQRKKRIQSS